MKVKVNSLSHVRLFATPWTIAYQASPFIGFSMQEYWSGLPFPSPQNLPNPGIEPRSPSLQGDSLLSELPGKSSTFLVPPNPSGLNFLLEALISASSLGQLSWDVTSQHFVFLVPWLFPDLLLASLLIWTHSLKAKPGIPSS